MAEDRKRKPRRKALRSVPEIYAHCELRGVRFTHVHASEIDDGGEVGKGRFEAHYDIADDNLTLFVHVRTFLTTRSAKYDVAAAAAYEAKRPFKVDDEVVADFIAMSALVTLAPFIREAVVSLAHRLEDLPAPVIPLMGPGVGSTFDEVTTSDDESSRD